MNFAPSNLLVFENVKPFQPSLQRHSPDTGSQPWELATSQLHLKIKISVTEGQVFQSHVLFPKQNFLRPSRVKCSINFPNL